MNPGLTRTGRDSGPPPTPRSGAFALSAQSAVSAAKPRPGKSQPGQGFAQRAAWMALSGASARRKRGKGLRPCC
jgi:hypothetical protein